MAETFLFKAVFDPGDSVQQVRSNAQRISHVLAESAGQKIEIGTLDLRNIESEAKRAGRTLGDQLAQEIRASFAKAYGFNTQSLFGANAGAALGRMREFGTGNIPFLEEVTRLEKAVNRMRHLDAVSRAPENASGVSSYTTTGGVRVRGVEGVDGAKALDDLRLERQLATARVGKLGADLYRKLENAALAPAQELLKEQAQRRAFMDRSMRAMRASIQTMERETAARERAAAQEQAQRRAFMDRSMRAMRASIAGMERETAARERQKLADEAGVAGGYGSRYDVAGDMSKVGRAMESVNRAAVRHQAATDALATEQAKASRSAASVSMAQERVRVAADQLAAAEQRLAVVSNQRSLREQFMTGFKGASETPYAQQIGQAFKFSVFYGTAYKALFAFTQTMQMTLQEGIEFQQAMTELKIATGRAGEEVNEIADVAGANAVAAGFAPSQGILTAARAQGLFGATDANGASLDEQRFVADVSSRVISRMATGSKFQPEELQANIAAIAQAFGTGAAGQQRVYDLDAYLARQFGISVGSTLESVAQSATVGRAAGFNQEQITAIAANLQSRTGQTPSAVAGFMAQIFSRGGEGTLTKIADRYNIDTEQDLSRQIAELSRVYQSASKAEQLEISAAFGRGKIQNAGVVLLEEWDVIMEAARKAREGASGAGDDAFRKRLDNLGGQINLTTGVIKDFASALSQTGLFELMGAGLITFRELLESVTSLIRVWNDLPGAIRLTIAAMAAWRIAMGTGALGGLAARGSGILGGAALGAAARGGVAGSVGVGLAGAAARGGLAATAVGGLAAFGPALLAIGGIYGLGQTLSANRGANAQQQANSALMSRSPEALSTEAYLAQASVLDSNVAETRDRLDSIWTKLGAGSGALRDQIAQMEADAEYFRKAAEEIESFEKPQFDEVLIESLDKDAIAAALQSISDSGGTARERLDALNIALNGTGKAAGDAASRLAPKAGQAALEIGSPLYEQLADMLNPQFTRQDRSALNRVLSPFGDGSNLFGSPDTRNIGAEKWRDFASPEDFNAFLEDLINEYGGLIELSDALRNGDAMSRIRELAKSFVDEAGASGGAGDLMEQDISVKIYDAIQARADLVRDVIEGNIVPTQEQLQVVFDVMISDLEGVLSNMPESDLKGRESAIRDQLDQMLQGLASASGSATPEVLRQVQSVRQLLFEAEFNRLDNERKVAQQNAKDADGVARVGQSILQQMINAAIESGNADNLVRVLEMAGRGAIAMAEASLNSAINTIREARAQQQRMAQLAAQMAPMFSGILGAASAVIGQAPIAEEGMLGALPGVISAGKDNVFDTGLDVPSVKDAANAAKGAKKAGMSPEERARRLQEYRHNLALLRIDQTDPLAVARLELREAQAELARSRKKGNKFDIAEDRVALQNAQTNLEATKFQQRLDDVQTAERLGRISHAQYIKYLENESKRLNRIKDRTRQQQDQLNQIDLLLKEASEASHDQWNFGKINLPKPYQVRRYIEASANGVRMDDRRENLQSRETRIYIDGADVAKVKEIINEHVGQPGRVTTTNQRRGRF